MTDRREFLKLMGSALGCALLAGCGGGGGGTGTGGVGASGGGGGAIGGGSVAALPSGYRLTPVINNGDSLSKGLSVVTNLVKQVGGTQAPENHPFASHFKNQKPYFPNLQAPPTPQNVQVLGALPGQVWVTDENQLGFFALDDQGGRGLYLADISSSGSTPVLENVRKILRIGDPLPDAPSAVRITPGDVNGNGTAAMQVLTGDNNRVAFYVYYDGKLEPLLTTFQRVPTLFPQGATNAVLFSAVSVNDDNSILLAPPLTSAWDMHTLGQGLLYLPKGSLSQASLLFHQGDLVPGTTSTVRTITSFQVHDKGQYVVLGTAQASGAHTQAPTSEGTLPQTYLMTGNAESTTQGPRLLSAHPSLGVARRQSAAQTFASGSILFEPRIGADGTTAYIVHTAVGTNTLYINGNPVITAVRDGSGTDRSPSGAVVTQLLAPVVGADGLVFCALGTTKGQELVVFSGGNASTIVKTGDTLGDRTVISVVMGMVARQANRTGRIAFRVDYLDTTSSLVIGDPV